MYSNYQNKLISYGIVQTIRAAVILNLVINNGCKSALLITYRLKEAG